MLIIRGLTIAIGNRCNDYYRYDVIATIVEVEKAVVEGCSIYEQAYPCSRP